MTRADLNSNAVRNYLFAEIVKLENIMEQYIATSIGCSWKDELGDSETAKIERRYEDTKKDNVQLNEIKCAGFSHKAGIIRSDNKAMEEAGLGNGSRGVLDDIIDLRNDVAHGHPIIISGNSFSNGRSVDDLIRTVEDIRSITDCLE